MGSIFGEMITTCSQMQQKAWHNSGTMNQRGLFFPFFFFFSFFIGSNAS